MPTLSAPDLLVFNAQPGATLLLSPDSIIVGASDDYLAATLTERDIIVGQNIFDAFPDNPETPEANGVANVRASIAQVLATKQPHEMAPQHYDVPDRTRPGRFVERHWQPRHTPVLDAAGQVQFIIQSVQDITARRLAERQLRASQTSEKAARSEAELQRTELQRVYQEAPVAMGLLRGSTFVVEWANTRMGTIWGRPLDQVVGRPHFEALPDLADQGFEQLFADVLTTGRTVALQELLVRIGQKQQAYQGYFNITYQPVYEGGQHITGILCSAFEVTDQVLARQQIQTLNEELAALNEELLASNEEYQQANIALAETQRQVWQLNQELEARVQERTGQLEAAQAATEHQRLQWHKLFMRAPAGICIFDGPEWVYEFVNPGYQAMFPGRELLGRRLLDALPEVADQPLMEILHRVYDTGESFEASEVLVPLARTEDGPVEDIYFDLTYQARRNEAGQIDGFITYAYDVTEQVRARREREAQQHLVNTVFEQAPAGIWVVRGSEHVFELINPMMTQILGRTPEQVLGRPYFEVMAELANQSLPALFRQVWEQGEPVFVGELAAQLAYHAPGEVGYFTFVFQPLRDEHGQMARISCVALDVTTQVRARQQVQDLNQELAAINEKLIAANEELHESNTQLTRTNVDLDNFIYTASHDLKAPISNIEGLLYLLRDELPAEVVEQGNVTPALHLMQEAIERFKHTIEHLTEVSKLQKEHAPSTQAVSLATVVEDVRQDLAPLIQETDVRLFVDVSDFPPVRFSKKNLRSVVYNLLSNALKYRSPDRSLHVDVRAHVQLGHTVLEVHDNGLGIESRHLPQLFTMFQRFHTHVEGTGIGLFMVKRMVDNAGGRMEVHSQLGAGTTFFVYLPHATST